MKIFESFNNFIDKQLGLNKPLTLEERQIIGREVSDALSTVRNLARHYANAPEFANAPIGRHIDRVLLIRFEGDVTDFKLTNFVDQNMKVIDFIAGVGDAFELWPYLLTQNNRPSKSQFSYAVKIALFQGNDAGWAAYVASMQARGLHWFGREDEAEFN